MRLQVVILVIVTILSMVIILVVVFILIVVVILYVVIIMVVAALVTPTTDPFNMAMLAVPMYLLFEACIWIAWWMERKEAAAR